MNRYLFLFLAGLLLIFIVYAGGEYVLCLLSHWLGFHLFSDRQAVSAACFSHLNPFHLFP